jgi:murein DD-endopeptidase MepM/ murein hydrolase activator NlpD
MAKSQYPLDGKIGKAWKITSPFGWRVHPIKKTKKHHNGVDIWQGSAVTYLEACFDGKVVGISTSVDPNGAGNKVVVQSTVMGKKITWTYFHMIAGSIKVKVGQKIEAGTVVGKMGATGFATGKHVHWEIWAGHLKSQPLAGFATGKGFYDPMKFTKAVIEFEKAHAAAPQATPDDAPATEMPAHSIPAEAEAPKPVVEAPKVVAPVVVSAPVKPALSEALKLGSKGSNVVYLQKSLGINPDGDFGPNTKAAVMKFQSAHDLVSDGIVGPKTWAIIK